MKWRQLYQLAQVTTKYVHCRRCRTAARIRMKLICKYIYIEKNWLEFKFSVSHPRLLAQSIIKDYYY